MPTSLLTHPNTGTKADKARNHRPRICCFQVCHQPQEDTVCFHLHEGPAQDWFTNTEGQGCQGLGKGGELLFNRAELLAEDEVLEMKVVMVAQQRESTWSH